MSRRFRTYLMPGLIAVAVMIGSMAWAADILGQFRLTNEDAEQSVFDTLWAGSPDAFGSAPSIFRSLSPQARAAAVTAGAAFVRAYCESDAFREAYAAKRQASRPVEIQTNTAAKVDVDKQTAEMQKAMAASREAMANMPPEMKKMMEAAMAQAGAAGTDMDAQMADLQKQGAKAMKEQNAAVAKADAKAAESRLNAKEFDQRYPANPDRFVAARLREFLALTATVPAETALVRRSGSLVFADPALEAKPAYWKQLYRAGQPSVDAARDAATKWLAALPVK
jgi:hypothetical protein